MKKYISYWLVIITLLGVNGTLGYFIYEKVAGKESNFLTSPAPLPSSSVTSNTAPQYSQSPKVSTNVTVSSTPKPNDNAVESPTPKPSDKAVVSSSSKPSDDEVKFDGQIFYKTYYDKGARNFGGKVLKEEAQSNYSMYWIAAKGTDITVKDSSGKIIGLFNVDENGKFNFNVKKDNFYQLELLFKNTKRTMKIKADDAKNLYIGYGLYSIYKGYFESGGYFGGSELME